MIDTTDGASKSPITVTGPIKAVPIQGRSYQITDRPATGGTKIKIKAKQVKLVPLSSKTEP